LTLASFVQFASPQAIADQLTLVLGQNAEYLHQQSILWAIADAGLVEKVYLHPPAG
jgi:hypothetical protein